MGDPDEPNAEGLGVRFPEAVREAQRYHSRQVRKGTEVPYVAHLLSVAALVIEDGGSEDEAIAALLHDAVEDAGGPPTLEEIRGRFGDHVATIVAACSDTEATPKPAWRARKEAYIVHLADEATTGDVLRVSLADKLHNGRAILYDYRQFGDELWTRFATRSAGDQLWYYRSLADVFLARSPGALSNELDRVVRELEWLVGVGFDGARLREPLEWKRAYGGGWFATGRTGTSWEINETGDGRFGCVVAEWDKPDWYTDTLADAQQLCDELDRNRGGLREYPVIGWIPTSD